MVKSDLGREAKTNAVKAAVIDGFMTVVMKSAKGGARMLVRSAVTRPEENGKHISDVPEDEWKQYAYPSLPWGSTLPAMANSKAGLCSIISWGQMDRRCRKWCGRKL